jgi:DNA invertase Pin-like site-specific DNA recombinase
MNCVLYARVSTDKQAEKELSIPAQLQAMRDYAHQRGWTITEEFLEPGASARTADRPELKRLLERCHVEHRPDVLLVHKIDRLARNVFDHATIRALLKQRGIRLASVVENVDESVSGELVENIMASIAQFYSGNLSDEVKKGMRQKVLTGGWPHRPPRGYALVRGTGNRNNVIEIHPKDGPLMKRAFELYATGWYSMKALTNRLAKDGLEASKGGPMPQAHLRRLLASSFYAGSVRWHELECQGTHQALISRELFEKVQDVTRRRYRNPGPKGSLIPGFPLRGLAVCASCRGRMTAERHGAFLYYRCSRQTYRRDLCPGRACNAERAHAGLERICGQIKITRQIANDVALAAHALIQARVTDFGTQRARLRDEEARLVASQMQLTQAFSRGDIAPNAFKAETAELRAKRQQFVQLATTEPISADQLEDHVSRTLQLATSFWDLYQPMNEHRKASLLTNLFDMLVLDHEGVAGFTLKEPFTTLMMADSQRHPAELATKILDAA